MTEFAQMILDRIADWPKEAQAELIDAIAEIEAKHFGVCRLSDEERSAVREGLAQAARGEFASDEDVATFFNRYRS
jgi:predicted transcriptional regulator